MDCTLIEPSLLAFALGSAEADEAARVEQHLVDCKACLVAFLALKRHIERPGPIERPSPAARARLFAEVERRYGRSAGATLRRAFARPIPLYQGVAAACLAVLVASLLPEIGASIDPPRVSSGERVDTSRERPQNLDLF